MSLNDRKINIKNAGEFKWEKIFSFFDKLLGTTRDLFRFEIMENDDGSRRYRFAGYATLYRFYYHPDMDRVRVAHVLLNPAYRHSGVGVKFLNAMYTDLCSKDEVYDITGQSNFRFK